MEAVAKDKIIRRDASPTRKIIGKKV